VTGKRKRLGNLGESLAGSYLERHHYQILHRNWRWGRYAEVDIIAYLPGERRISFIEVKTRRTEVYGTALEAVTTVQQRKLRALAEVYLVNHAHTIPYADVSFDVITITPSHVPGSDPLVTHYENAF